MTKAIIKNKGGRPTKYNEGMILKIDEYMQTVGREQTSLPSLEGLANYLDINVDTVHEWKKKHKKFSDSIKKILGHQKQQLMDDGMYGGKDVNASMAIFLLKANHQMKEPPTMQFNQQINMGKVYVELPERKSVLKGEEVK